VGLSAVFVFLIIYYLFAGVVASIALAINLALLVGIMMFLEATLTLPGIAGIVLTLGMAVDANILIFERIREEKDKGKTLAQSVKNGFERAFITIVDANATTFITGFILYKFGTGPLKGFAATLMIGICTSLFAALLVSKVIFATMIENNWLKKLNMLRFLKSPKINFLTAMPPAGMISLLVILGGLVCFFIADESKYGLDFTGGYNVQLKCEEGTTQADVQTKLGAVYPNVQVVSIKQGLTGTLREPYEHFDVKIKSTSASDQSPDPEDTEDYLTRIKELLAEHIISDPITEIDIRPDEARGIAEVRFVLNLAEPTDQETVSQALGEVLRIENIQPLDEDSFQINAVYTRGTTLTELELQGFVSVQVEQAAMTEGVGIALLDPFPMTGFIGPTVGSELRDKAVIAILLSLLAIIIYIRIRFKEYKYGFAAASALVHDVLITLGAVAVARLTGIVDVEIGLPLIAAFLTIIGYSLNDTIVVFDRVRENLPRMNLPFRDLVNTSINQTLARTILTSLTTLTVVIILFAINYGQRNVLEGFSFALIVGVIVGTYSSIFVASPVLLAIHKIGEVEAKGAQPSDRGKEGRGKKKKSGKASKTAK
jgi:SecD/SecF fusion protein